MERLQDEIKEMQKGKKYQLEDNLHTGYEDLAIFFGEDPGTDVIQVVVDFAAQFAVNT